MRKTHVLFFIFLLTFNACDVMHDFTVINYTDRYQEVTFKSRLDSATFYTALPNDVFSEGKLIGTKALSLINRQNENRSKYRFVSVLVPPNQKVIINKDLWLYPEEFPIIVNNDTVPSDSLIVRKSFKGHKHILVLK